uniref:Uncharacterized protein n=1 Tax=Heterorhabditis bacteriophora TaxID=37862 RepID=A0A1I7WUG8_HETBA
MIVSNQLLLEQRCCVRRCSLQVLFSKLYVDIFKNLAGYQQNKTLLGFFCYLIGMASWCRSYEVGKAVRDRFLHILSVKSAKRYARKRGFRLFLNEIAVDRSIGTFRCTWTVGLEDSEESKFI